MHVDKLRVQKLFKDNSNKYPNFNQRIRQNRLEGKPNLIIIDGKSQTGKSTLARYICSEFDKDYKLFFTVDDILQYLAFLRNNLETKDDKLFLPLIYQDKWTFFDEPQLETPRQSFWSDRNMILQAYTSSFGFLHNHLVMALPNIKGISDIILTNITFRISVMSRLKNNNEILRKAYVKIPLFNDNKNKWYWVTVEEYRIPKIDSDLNYDSRKTNNFFNVQLPKWENQLNKNKWMPTGASINPILNKKEDWQKKEFYQ